VSITPVQMSAGNSAASGSSINDSLTGVTAGNYLVVFAWIASGSGHTFLTSELTKSAGTATIGAVSIAGQHSYDPTGGGQTADEVIFIVPITGSGDLTLHLAPGSTAGLEIGMEEVDFGSDPVVEDSDTYEDNNPGSTYDTTPDVTAAGDAYFAAVMACGTSNNGTITQDSPWVVVHEQETGSTYITGSAIRQVESGGLTDGAGWTITFSGGNFGSLGLVVVLKQSAAPRSCDFAADTMDEDDVTGGTGKQVTATLTSDAWVPA
jgi:hypothetical protein